MGDLLGASDFDSIGFDTDATLRQGDSSNLSPTSIDKIVLRRATAKCTMNISGKLKRYLPLTSTCTLTVAMSLSADDEHV